MRRIIFVLVLILSFFYFQPGVYAQNTKASYDFVYNNVRYKITSYQDRTVELASIDPSFSGANLNIPQTVQYEGITFTVSTLGIRCCAGYKDLQSVDIPESVITIGDNAFDGCTGLSSVNMKEGILSLGEFVFQNCSNLSIVNLPNSIRELGYECFGTSGLSSFTCPDSLRYIGKWCFYGCNLLTNVIFNDSLNVIDDMAFSNCSLTELNLPPGLHTIGTNTFQYCKFKTVKIPQKVTVVQGFQHCEELEEIVLPDSMLEITNFVGCINLKKLDMKQCSYLKSASFGRTGLKHIEFPDTVYTWTSDYYRLEIPIPGTERKQESKITISSGAGLDLDTLVLTHAIGNISGAFKETTIKHLFVKQEVPMRVSGENTFSAKTYLSGVLHVPTGTKDAYQAANVWKNFVNIVDDIVLPAKKYNLIYLIDGKEYKTYSVTVGAEIIIEPDPTKEGYTFSGWSEIPKTMPANDLTITGTFTQNSPTEKCVMPTISFVDGKLLFESSTDGAECHYEIKVEDAKVGVGVEITLNSAYEITVYASKVGYNDSEKNTATLYWVNVDPILNGVIDSEIRVNTNAILVQNNGGLIAISGVADDNDVAVYNISGQYIATGTVSGNYVEISTNLSSGDTCFIKVGDRSMKYLLR